MAKTLKDARQLINDELKNELAEIDARAAAAREAAHARAADSLRLAGWLLSDDSVPEKATQPVKAAPDATAKRPSPNRAAEEAAKALKTNFSVHDVRDWIETKYPGFVGSVGKSSWTNAMYTLKKRHLLKLVEQRPGNEGALYDWVGPP